MEINSMIELFTAKERRNYIYEQADFRTLTLEESEEITDLEDEIYYFENNN